MSKRWQKGLDAVKRQPSSASRIDAGGEWMNAYTGLGVLGRDKRLGGAFELTPVSDLEATDLWRGDDIAARVIEMLPDEMLRQGFEIRIAEPRKPAAKKPGEPSEPGAADEPYGEAAARGDADGWFKRRRQRRDAEDRNVKLAEQITAKLEDLGFAKAAFDALCYERAYGGAAIMLGAKDGSNTSQPLRPEAVKSLDWLTTLEPRECQPVAWYNDPQKPKFGEAAIYEVNPVSDGVSLPRAIQVHESRLIIFGGTKVSRRTLAGTLPGWGDSALTRMYRVLRDFNISWSAVSILLTEYSQTSIGITDLSEIMSSGNGAALRDRFTALALGRSVANAVLYDAEKEKIGRESISLTGLHEMMEKMSARLAAACDMPLTLLMGSSPGGLNATGESDVRGWYDRVKARQDRKLRPVIERVVKMLFQVLKATEPDSWSVHFNPLWQPTDKERADTMLVMATADEKNIASGILSAEEVAKNRFGTECYSLETIIDWELREAAKPMAPPPAKTEQQMEQEQADRDVMTRELDIKQTGVEAKSLRKPE